MSLRPTLRPLALLSILALVTTAQACGNAGDGGGGSAGGASGGDAASDVVASGDGAISVVDSAVADGKVGDSGAGPDGDGADIAGGDGASADGGANIDGGGNDGGSDGGGKPVTLEVALSLDEAKPRCAISEASAPPAGTETVFAFSVNGGAYEALDATVALSADFEGAVEGCDVLQCRATATVAGADASGESSKEQLPMGDACGAGCWSCGAEGGCTAATTACDDGDACTTADTCGAAGCAGTPVAAEQWYADGDNDGFGGALYNGTSCGVPSASALAGSAYVQKAGDCDDNNAAAFPGAAEVCDGVDTDCSGGGDEDVCKDVVPEGFSDFETDTPMTGDTYEVEAKGKVDAGPLGEVEVKGKITKTGKDATPTYCLEGAVADSGGPLAIEAGTVAVCKDAAGVVTTTLTGKGKLDGAEADVVCEVGLGADGKVVCEAASIVLLAVPTTGATIAWGKGDGAVSVSGAKAVIDYLGQKLPVTLEGAIVPGKDSKLAGPVDVGASADGFKLLGKAGGAAIGEGEAVVERVADVVTTSLDLGAKDALLGAAGDNATKAAVFSVAASRPGAAAWGLQLDLDKLALAPFDGLHLLGKASEGDASFCATGELGVTPKGAKASAQLSVCFAEGKDPAFSLSALVDVPPVGEVAVTADYELGAKTLCLTGKSGSQLPALNADTAAADLLGVACIDLGSKAFADPFLRATPSLPPLGDVELEGKAEGDALCLSGATTLDVGGAPLALTAIGCTDKTLKALQATASATLTMPPFGDIAATATLGDKPGEVCFAAGVPAKLAFAASDIKLVATHCVAKGKDESGAAKWAFTAGPSAALSLTHDKLGTFTLAGVWDADKAGSGGSKGVLCVEGTLPAKATALLPLPGATVLGVRGTTCYGKDGFEGMALGTTLRLGDADAPGAVWLDAQGGLDAAGGACATSAKTAEACDALNAAWAKSSENPADVPDDRYTWVGATCYDALAATGAACSDAGGSWKTDIGGRFSLGLTPFCQKAGSASCGYADSCDVAAGDSVCAQSWTPFAGLAGKAPAGVSGLTFTKLAGYIVADKESATLGLDADASFGGGKGTLTLIEVDGSPLLMLEKIGVHAVVNSKGAFEVALASEAELDLGAVDFPAWSVRALLRAAVSDKGASFYGRVLPTSCDAAGACAFPAVEPFEKLVGKGAFAVQSKGAEVMFEVDWQPAATTALVVQLRTAGTVELLGNAKAEVAVNVRAAWPKAGGGAGKPKAALTFAAILQSFAVKAGEITLELGKVSAGNAVEVKPIVLLGSTEAVKALPVDTDGDLANGTEASWDIPKGLTLRTSAEITHLADLFETVTAQLDLTLKGSSQFHIRGEIKTKWDLIKPEYGIPTLHSAGLASVFVDLDVAATVVLKIGGTADFVTLDRKGGKHPLVGLAEFEVDSTSSIGGTVALTGLWQEPFFIPNLALMDMGISMKLQPAVPPVPTAFGFTGTGLLLKDDFDAPWPKIGKDAQNNPVGVHPDGSLMDKLPPQVMTIGNSLYLDTAPTPSGFCVAGTCPPMPSLLIRMDRQNLSTEDVVWAVGQMQKGLATLAKETKQMQVRDPVSGKMKTIDSPFGPIVDRFPLDKPVTIDIPDDVKVELHRGLVYLSTHEQSRFGLDWPFGFRMELDASMVVPAGKEKGQTKKLRMSGAMDTAGVELHGRMSPLQVIDGIDLVADPYRKVAALGAGGTLAVPKAVAAAAPGTVELAVVGPAKGGVTLLEAKAGERLVRLSETNTLYEPCDPDADLTPTLPDGSKVDCKVKVPALQLELTTDDASVPADARARVVRSARGVRAADVPQRVAYTVDAKGRVALYVDGRSVTLVDSADGADGLAGTGDDLARFAAPSVDAAFTVGGAGVTSVDDLRFWKTARSAEAISRTLERPLKGAHNDAALLAWYEVDFDETFDKAGGAVVLHDSHLPGAHGSYVGAAAPALDKLDQDLRIDLSLPVLDPTAAGMGFEAGIGLVLPAPIAALLGTPKIAVAARLHASKALMEGRLYTRTLTIVPIPTIGGFVLSGDGPNGKSGDFDDGLYFEPSFAPGLDTGSDHLPSLDASARLVLDWEGNEHPIGQVTTRMGCLAKSAEGAAFTGKPCALGAGYHLYVETKLGADGALSLPLGGKDKLELAGSFLATTLDAPFRIVASSGLGAYGRTLAKQTLLIDGKGISATGSFDLGNIAGVDFGAAASLGVTFDWQPLRLCGSGKTSVEVPTLASFKGDITACFGHQPMASFSGSAKTGTLGALAIPVTDLAVTLDSSKGLLIDKARLEVPYLYDGQLKGYFKKATDFNVTGSSVTSPGGGALLKFSTKATAYRSGSKGGATLNATLDTSKSVFGNWASGTISGGLEASGGKLYWGLAGNASLSPGGFKLASARFWACNPSSTGVAGIPTECKSTTYAGFGAKGQVDVGIAKVNLLGKVNFGKQLGGKTTDTLELAGNLSASIFKTFNVSGTVQSRLSTPAVSGYNGLTMNGSMTAFGLKQNFSSSLSAGSDGRPKNVSITISGTLKPYSKLSLSSGKATMTWTPKSTSGSASGKVTIGNVLSTNVSTNVNSSRGYTFTGSGIVRIANLMKASTAISLNSSGAYINTSMTANTDVVDLKGNLKGTIPYDGKFSFSGGGSLKLGAFPWANVADFEGHYSNGISGSAAVDLKVVKMTVSSSASPNGTGIKVNGTQTYNWTIGNFNFPYVTEAVKYVASALSGWSCSSYCVEKVLGQCVLYWFKCTKKTTHDDYKSVGAKVTFNLSGTSYVSSHNIALKATATLNVGPVKGSSSTTCGIGSKPSCCFKFPSPVGSQCLKLY